MRMIALGEIMPARIPSVDPSKNKDETFELWSIPAHDAGAPEMLRGAEIGSSKKCVEPNDVLLARIVPHIRRSTVVKASRGFRQIASGEWITFRDSRFHPEYLRHILTSDPFHAEFMQTVAGVGGSLLRARPEGVKSIKIPLPPLEEQKRIAAILDQADALRRLRRRALDRLNPLGQAIFYEMFGASTESRHATPLGDICGRITKGESPKWQGFDYQDDGPLFITSENVGWGDLKANEGKRIPLGFHKKLSRSKLAEGDLLVNLVGASIGRACIFDRQDEANINQAVGVITLDERHEELRSFILALLLSSHGQTYLLGSRVEGARANISLSDLRGMPIFRPSPQEAASFNARLTCSITAKRKQAEAVDKSEQLFTSLQHRAFRGEL